MTPRAPDRDERTTAVENAGYRLSYLILSFGVLASAAYRGLAAGEQPWDLLGIVVLGGLVHTLYQAWHRVVYPRWLVLVALTVASALLVAALLVGLRPG